MKIVEKVIKVTLLQRIPIEEYEEKDFEEKRRRKEILERANKDYFKEQERNARHHIQYEFKDIRRDTLC